MAVVDYDSGRCFFHLAPLCGERSDRIVRCDPGEGLSASPSVTEFAEQPLTPTLSP